MRNVDGATLYSASDLINFLGCAHATVRDLRQLTAPVALPPDDEQAVLLQEKGIDLRARLPLRVHIKTNHTNGLWARESSQHEPRGGPEIDLVHWLFGARPSRHLDQASFQRDLVVD